MNIEIPKVELHVHLDGSVRIETLAELSGISLEEAQEKSIASPQCSNLSEYLTRFDLACSVMQTEENLSRIARELGEDLKKDHVIYAEVRFYPLAHLKAGLSKEKVVESVLEGFKQVDIPINLILCMMRHEPIEKNMEVISLANKFKKKGVVAIDLAGDESKYPTSSFRPLFALASELGIPFTIHAGESAGAESIKEAIEMGTKRIGHGIHAIEDREVLNLIKSNQILLEMCPTSNIQTKAIQNIKEYPLYDFYQKNILVSINTDNRTVSFTNLKKEYELLAKNFSLQLEDFCNINKMAIASSFMEESLKKELIKYLDCYLEQFSK